MKEPLNILQILNTLIYSAQKSKICIHQRRKMSFAVYLEDNMENLPSSLGINIGVNIPNCTQVAQEDNTHFHQECLLDRVKTHYGLFCDKSHRRCFKFMTDLTFL